jgi:molybdopterin-guanine dinucleotide biosynthesis protein A
MLWTAAIIAGGPASRLGGRDKSGLPVNGRSILDRQLAALGPLTDRILVVANHPDRFRASGLPVVRDVLPGAAALGGIYTALISAPTEYVLVVACDLPFLTERFLDHLARCAPGVDLAIPRSADGYQPMCACYSRECLEPIRRRIADGSLRVQDLATEVRTREIGPEELAAYDPDGLLFFNVNTTGDYERAQHLARRFDGRPEASDDGITRRGLPEAHKAGTRR